MDAEILADVSDYPGLQNINQAYIDIDEALEFVPKDGTFAVPYVANAAGILYNRDMFEEHGWEIPENWEELNALCDTIQAEGFFLFILVSRIRGLVWRRGMLWQWIFRRRIRPNRSIAGRLHFPTEYRELSERYLIPAAV